VAAGDGGDSLAYSSDGISWIASSSGSNIFANGAYAVAWNGALWVAGGAVAAGNALAYSYDGDNWIASANGSAIITGTVYGVAWNGALWVAGGTGGDTLAYSSNGDNWTASTNGSSIITGTVYGAASRRVLPYVGNQQIPLNVKANQAIAIGGGAGNTTQGANAIAIGRLAGETNQGANSIVLNASGSALNGANAGFYVRPIRSFVQTSGVYSLYYNYNGTSLSGDQYEITVSSSDQRLKTDISDTQLGLDFINALRPVEFRWKDKNIGYLYDTSGNSPTGTNPGTRLHEGFIAQEVKAVLEAQGVDCGIFMELNDGPDSIKGLNALRYDEFIGPMVKAIQQQNAIIQTLQDQLAAIQQQLNPSP
jgi:hypothetical protein